MKMRTVFTLVICGIMSGWFLQPVLAGKGKGNRSKKSTSALTDAERKDLLLMREEEKLARDVYRTLYAEYELRVFNNIPKAEQRHMDAVLGLLDQYGLQDPALDSLGKFSDPELQSLYDTLVAKGLQSKLDALMVGALIEEVDMEDLVDAMKRTDKSDILAVYGNLLSGSKRHMNAFVRNIEATTGETYVAQHISQEEVDTILGR